MATLLTAQQFTRILLDPNIIKKEDILLFQTIYACSNHRASATQISKILGYKNLVVANGQIGRIAKRIGKKYDIQFTQRQNLKFKYWDLFFTGKRIGRYFLWQLRPALLTALEKLNLPLKFNYPEEIPVETSIKYPEGFRQTITVNAYERNAAARDKCIEAYGSICCICSIDFSKTYGDIGTGYIHVHHLVPLSKIRKEYEVDPINDLIPVCPNCHSMLHTQNPPFTIDELKLKFNENI